MSAVKSTRCTAKPSLSQARFASRGSAKNGEVKRIASACTPWSRSTQSASSESRPPEQRQSARPLRGAAEPSAGVGGAGDFSSSFIGADYRGRGARCQSGSGGRFAPRSPFC